MTDVLFLREKNKRANPNEDMILSEPSQQNKAPDQNTNKKFKRKERKHEPGDEGVKVIDSLGMFWLVRSKLNILLVDKP